MDAVHFSDDLLTGDEALDNEHRLIFFLTNNMEGAIYGGALPVDLNTYVNILKAHAARHFSHEEDYMTRHAYEGLAEHREEHLKFARAVEAMEEKAAAGTLGFEEVRQAVVDWLHTHIREVDRKMIQTIKAPFPVQAEASN